MADLKQAEFYRGKCIELERRLAAIHKLAMGEYGVSISTLHEIRNMATEHTQGKLTLDALELAEALICGRLEGEDVENRIVLPAIRAALSEAKRE